MHERIFLFPFVNLCIGLLAITLWHIVMTEWLIGLGTKFNVCSYVCQLQLSHFNINWILDYENQYKNSIEVSIFWASSFKSLRIIWLNSLQGTPQTFNINVLVAYVSKIRILITFWMAFFVVNNHEQDDHTSTSRWYHNRIIFELSHFFDSPWFYYLFKA